MKILKAYLRREFLKFFTFILAGFVGLYLVVEFFERVDDFVEHHATGTAIIKYFAYKAPLIVFQVVPFAVLLATVITFCILAKNNEITAMKANGVPLIVIASPILALALLVSGIVLAANEYLIPYTNRKHHYTFDITIRHRQIPGLVRSSRIWYLGSDNTIWNIHLLDKTHHTLHGVTLFRMSADNKVFQRIDASHATWEEGLWNFKEVYIRDFHHDGSFRTEYFPVKALPFAELPDVFAEIQKDPQEMNFTEIRRLVHEIHSSGYYDARYAVEMNAKLATPLTAFIMALFGIPFSLRTSRHGGVFTGIALSVVVGFSYWILTSVSIALGYSGYLPPLLSAWSSNLLFSSSGLYLLLSVPQ